MSGLIEVADARADREAWLEARKGYLCGSEVAQVLGCSKWGERGADGKTTPLSPAQQRVRACRGKAGLETFEETERMRWGRVMQETIVAELGHVSDGCKGWNAETYEWLVQDPVCEQLAATPDCWIHHPELGRIPGEIKFTSYQWRVKAADRDIPGVHPAPIDYQIQCQIAMAVTSTTHCVLIEQHSNMTHPHIFERNDAVIQRARDAAPIFLAEVAQLLGESNGE